MKRLLPLIVLLLAPLAYAATPQSVIISPHGAILEGAGSQTFTAVCHYSDGTADDDCTAAGGVTWSSSRVAAATVTSGGVATAIDPGTGQATCTAGAVNPNSSNACFSYGSIEATAGGVVDSVGIVTIHAGDVVYPYPTPSIKQYVKYNDESQLIPLTLAEGATATVGETIWLNTPDGGHTGISMSTSCTWSSSFPSVATVDRDGHVTAVSATALGDGGVAGKVTITCGLAGNATLGTSNVSNWVSPGNVISFQVVAGGTGNTTWYVRPDGGSPYTNSTDTPYGQCSGKVDAAYPPGYSVVQWTTSHTYSVGDMIADEQTGHVQQVVIAGTSGVDEPTFSTTGATTTDGTVTWTDLGAYPVNQPCAFGYVTDLWADRVGYETLKWVIQGGDTVIVRKQTGLNQDGFDGYLVGNRTYGVGFGSEFRNCHTSWGCTMPTIPSGTAAQHTRLLGENYGSCTSDSAKTKLISGTRSAINISDSQFVDVACFEITDTSPCASSSNFDNACSKLPTTGVQGTFGVFQTAFSSHDNMTDLFIHGLTGDGLYGASGDETLVYNRIRLRAMPDAGINMDDDPWGFGNSSQAGGFTLKNSITEDTGCVEEYPVVHNYPFIECRGQGSQGGYADGFGTASANGNWYFDHDIWQRNWQDGLDLLHSGMNILSVTNSMSRDNNGQPYKIGSGKHVIFRNNKIIATCNRKIALFGDEPDAIRPGADPCRGNDGLPISIDPHGEDLFQNNTYFGSQNVIFDMLCGSDDCSTGHTVLQNNIIWGIADENAQANPGVLPAAFYGDFSVLPKGDGANDGWSVRDHNLYYNLKNGCPTGPNELCESPLFRNQYGLADVPLGASNETWSDNIDGSLTVDSHAIGAGIAISGITTDFDNVNRTDPPAIGALEYKAGTLLTVTVSPGSASMTVGGNTTFTAACAYDNGDTMPCTVTWSDTNVHSSVNSVTGVVTGVSAGTDTITATLNSVSGTATVTINNPPPFKFMLGVQSLRGNIR